VPHEYDLLQQLSKDVADAAGMIPDQSIFDKTDKAPQQNELEFSPAEKQKVPSLLDTISPFLSSISPINTQATQLPPLTQPPPILAKNQHVNRNLFVTNLLKIPPNPFAIAHRMSHHKPHPIKMRNSNKIPVPMQVKKVLFFVLFIFQQSQKGNNPTQLTIQTESLVEKTAITEPVPEPIIVMTLTETLPERVLSPKRKADEHDLLVTKVLFFFL
jgi:hypothetical protein